MSVRRYVPTGIEGLDTMLDGKGIPRGYVVLVLGSPGCGKTTLGVQFIYSGVTEHGENGVIVLLEEDPETIKENMLAFGWDLAKLEKDGKIAIIDASPIRLLAGAEKTGRINIGTREFQMASLIDMITKSVDKVGATRMVVDSIATLIIQYPNEAERRGAVLDLVQGAVSTGCTTLLVSELAYSAPERPYQIEEYLAHGVILMQRFLKTGGMVYALTVEKMKGVNHDRQPRPYKISDKGIEVHATGIVL